MSNPYGRFFNLEDINLVQSLATLFFWDFFEWENFSAELHYTNHDILMCYAYKISALVISFIPQ